MAGRECLRFSSPANAAKGGGGGDGDDDDDDDDADVPDTAALSTTEDEAILISTERAAIERKLSPRSANSPTEAAACRLSRPAPRLEDVDEDDEEEDAPHDEQWSVPTYLRRECGSMPHPSSWTVMMEDGDAELVPAAAAPLPTTTATVVADAEAAFRTSSSTARPTLPMTVPARTAPEATVERGRTRPPPLLLVLVGLLTVLMMVMVTVQFKLPCLKRL